MLAAAVVPHPPLLVPDLAAGAAGSVAPLLAACDAVVAGLLAHSPRTVVLIGSVAMAIAIMVQIALSQAGAPDVRLVLITLLDLVMYSIVGFAAGVLLPYAVAGPLSVVVPLLWLTFVPAMYPVWLRHLTGLFRDCCALQWDLAPQALLASTIVNVSIIAAALLVLGPPRGRRRPLALPTIIIASALGTGTILVAGMPYAPAVARDTTSLQCRPAGDTVVCLWPEHSEEAAEIAGVAADVSARWAAAGIAVPAEFTEADPETVSAGAAAMVLSASELNRDRIVAALAASLLPAEPECPAGSSGGIAVEYLQAWYWATGGISREVLEAQYNYDPTPFAPVMDVVRQLEAASVEARRDWQARAEQVSQFCDEEWSPGLLRVGG